VCEKCTSGSCEINHLEFCEPFGVLDQKFNGVRVFESNFEQFKKALISAGATYELKHPFTPVVSKTHGCCRKINRGKRKGEKCGKKVYKERICYRHWHKKYWYLL